MQLEQLRALVAVVDEESFEAAARRLGITPSAVSQRIRTLETSTSRVLVQRGTPCTATEAGEILLRSARQIDLVMGETRQAMAASGGAAGPGADEGEGEQRAVLSVGVNADSLATWFPEVLIAAAAWDDAVLRLRVDDQEHTPTMLTRGEVLGAVTTSTRQVTGCTVRPLGVMRYLPVAAPSLLERYAGTDSVDLACLPVVQFNAKDSLQDAVRTPEEVRAAPWHQVPSSEGFSRAVRAGLGWGMLPERQIGAALDSGRLQLVPGMAHQDVLLHWQVWSLDSRHLQRLTDTILEAARALRPPPSAS